MTVILILVVFASGEGSEPVTAKFATMVACEAGALAMFEEVDDAPVAAPFELTAGSDVIEGTMIVRGRNGADLGMFSCGPLRMAGGRGE